MDGRRIDAILEMAEAAIPNGTYLAISPQGTVAATVEAAGSSEDGGPSIGNHDIRVIAQRAR